MKPFSESCVQNQAEICSVLETLLADKKHVLEIGSGTGQHAVYFAEHLPHLIWQTSDQQQYHQGINLWLDGAGLDEARLNNIRAPISLDVSQDRWPQRNVVRNDVQNVQEDTIQNIDALFSANAIHIMTWQNVIDYFTYGAQLLEKNGLFVLYGPFNYKGNYTSDSNANFDQWLKARDLESGIRDFEALDELANKNNMKLVHDIEMAANNRILCWEKI